MRELIPFGRDVPCPACGIALEIRSVCPEPHPDLDMGVAAGVTRLEHLHVECAGCGWSGYMATAGGQAPPPPADAPSSARSGAA